MEQLNKELADKLADVIKINYIAIINKTTGNYGVIDHVSNDSKKYIIKYGRNAGVHYLFDVFDGSKKIATGDFPAIKVADEYMVIRFYSGEDVISEYRLNA